MKHFLVSLHLLGSFLQIMSQCTVPRSEFHLEGDYLVGGLFDIHEVTAKLHNRPEAINCLSQPFVSSSHRRFQLMRFSVEEINNSTDLLPDVSLGYEIFDYCTDVQNFPSIFKLISVNGLIQAQNEPHNNLSKVVAVVGLYTSTETRTAAPFFMKNLIPMVSYGASSSIFSRKQIFPSFLRTARPNKDIMQVIVNIVLHFKWQWVAFLTSDNDYGNDGLDLFTKMIRKTDICLAYTNSLNHHTDYTQIFKRINAQNISIIIVFALERTAEVLIESAIQLNVTNKVWIAGDAWSLNKKLPKVIGIKSIGTVLGVCEVAMAIPGFSDFIHRSKSHARCESDGQQKFCNQVCNCSSLSPEEIFAADPSFSFSVYSAVYAIAHALHKVLQCGAGRCNRNVTVLPRMVLAELKKSNFTLLNETIHFDENGDPMFGSYSIIYWNDNGDAEVVGISTFQPSFHLLINNSKIQWYSNEDVPTSKCSQECKAGHVKYQGGIHKCCFTCEICPRDTYVNTTEDPYKCNVCKKTEWSAEGSTSCNLRVVEYMPFTSPIAILIMIGAVALEILTLAISVLFSINYNTPIVRSAGGPMCFLILGCLSLSSLSVFFFFGKPTPPFCILRLLPFILFYTVCVACFVVRSFQIVCIFKMAAKFPNLYSWWTKYHGQWLVITGAFVMQAVLLLIGYSQETPKPYDETLWSPDKIILTCDTNLKGTAGSVILLSSLCCLCFIFSYMGKDLPKNYNEAKAITFCLLLLIVTWMVFATAYILYHDMFIQILNSLAVLFSLYYFLMWYFLPKCYIIIFQPQKNTPQYFQGLIQNYTKTISQ
ncbi:taste receptor type 1 member 1-like [Mastacembelus armatus]|uniref:taste receptor type 1 member 1-like n=1 Tax=Mastacembelus armatus TaxID=205130 RepID=UPI000E4646C0|nr:taste receptor type 1 member 1-like [Mastacembelus armatus]